MKKKLREEAGLTLVEMLAATAILMLLALMLNTGLQMMIHSYQTMIARSEVELLLSTTVDALADDLRYAWNVTGTGDTADGKIVFSDFTYSSDSFEGKISLKLNDDQIMAYNVDNPAIGGKRLLPTGAYGSGAIVSYKKYKVTEMKLTHKVESNEVIFTIYLKVATEDGKISAETPGEGVTVRCLNPKKGDT